MIDDFYEELLKDGYVNILDIDLNKYGDLEHKDYGDALIERILDCIRSNFSALDDSQDVDVSKIYCKVKNHILLIKANPKYELRIVPVRRTSEDTPLYEVSINNSRRPGILVNMYDLVSISKFYTAVLSKQILEEVDND